MDSSLVSLHLIDLNIIFGVRYFPKGIFPRATSQVTISQVATTQMCNFPSGNFPKVRLGPLRRCRLKWGPSAAARTDLGSCDLKNATFGKNPLGKYLSNFVSKKVMNSVDF